MSGLGTLASGHRIPRLLVLFPGLLALALALAPACALADCSVHGSIYDWSTFSTVDHAVVSVYAMPGMLLIGHPVASVGTYAISLPAGNYSIVATSGIAGTPDEVSGYENFTILDGARDAQVDLILFPGGALTGLEGFDDDNATATPTATAQPSEQATPTAALSGEQGWVLYLGLGAIALAIVAIVAGLLLLRRIRPKPPVETPPATTAPPEPVVEPPVEPPVPAVKETQAVQPPSPSAPDLLLPQDCREVLAIMEKNGGRITQLDLRKALPYSEAKVSLIVSDLESRGLVKKIKKGRGNVLILSHLGEEPEK